MPREALTLFFWISALILLIISVQAEIYDKHHHRDGGGDLKG